MLLDKSTLDNLFPNGYKTITDNSYARVFVLPTNIDKPIKIIFEPQIEPIFIKNIKKNN